MMGYVNIENQTEFLIGTEDKQALYHCLNKDTKQFAPIKIRGWNKVSVENANYGSVSRDS
jgi:hypothetical protein